MPRVSTEHLEARKRQILIAAYHCFGERGFHKTTMRDICRAANLSAGAVYNYFTSKEEIVEAVAECGRSSTRSLVDSIDRPEGAAEALAGIAAELIPMLDDPAGAESARFDVRLWGEAVHTPRLRKLFRKARDSAGDPFVEIIRKGQDKGEIRKHLDARAVGTVLLAILLGLQVQKAIDPQMKAGECTEVVKSLLTGAFARSKA